jgi:hypothetical protein
MASPPVFGRKGSSCDAPPALARRCRRLALIRFYGRGEWGEPGTPAGMYRAHEAAGMKTASHGFRQAAAKAKRLEEHTTLTPRMRRRRR